MNTGQRVKELREKNRIKQIELAEHLGITSASMSAIENGKTNPAYETLIRISEYFGVSTDYLIMGKEKETLSEREQEIIEMLREDNKLNEAINKALEAKKKAINYIVDNYSNLKAA